MKSFIALLVFLSPILCAAQSHMFGLKTGVGLSRVNISQFSNDGQKARAGFTGGITYDYYLPNNFSFGCEILYQQRGYAQTIIIRDVLNNVVTEFEAKSRANYIAVPLKVSYTFGQKWFGFVSAGVLPAFLINATDHDFDPNTGQAENVDTKSTTNNFDLGMVGEIGGGYKFDREWLYISIADNSSFTDTYKSNYTGHHRGITFAVGLRHRIK